MKTLSMKQPFAELLISGKKTLELRNWKTDHRGLLLIHASKEPYREICEEYRINYSNLDYSAIIGVVHLDGIKTYADKETMLRDFNKHLAPEDYFADLAYPAERAHAWIVSDPRRFAKPIPNVRGALSLWEYDLPEGFCIEEA